MPAHDKLPIIERSNSIEKTEQTIIPITICLRCVFGYFSLEHPPDFQGS